ncbi:MAG: hypothetical protein NTY01_05235 [Verrucomicrobia bacterium]|nr:hypothetical protein [Verrucomicrobiota bacterium]
MESALLLALVAVVVILVVRMVGSRVTGTHDNIQGQMETQGLTDSSPQAASGTGSSSSGGRQKSNTGNHNGHASD